jgi:hypothetical protein
MQPLVNKQSLNNIFNKMTRVYPDLALQMALSGLCLNQDKMYDQIDCLLTVATLREMQKVK